MEIGGLKNPRWIQWVSQSLNGIPPSHIAAQWSQKHTRKDSISAFRVKLTVGSELNRGSGLERIHRLDPTGRLKTILRDAYQPKLTNRLVMLVAISRTLAQQEGVSALDYALTSAEESQLGKHPTKFLQYLRKLPI